MRKVNNQEEVKENNNQILTYHYIREAEPDRATQWRR